MPIEEVFPHVMFRISSIGIRDSVVVTWALMLILVLSSFLATRRLKDMPGPLQNAAEAAVDGLLGMIRPSSPAEPERLLPLVGGIAVFLVMANSVAMIPRIGAPTRDLNTTLAMATVVFIAVHAHAAHSLGFVGYLRTYLEPHWALLPFNVVGELTRTLTLALRLFGNILSGELVMAVILIVAGFIVPVVFQLFHLFIGLIQAYVFSLLTLVYLTALTETTARSGTERGEVAS